MNAAPVTTIDIDFLFRKAPANIKKLDAVLEQRTHFRRKRIGIWDVVPLDHAR
jgi:hypothetical protein